ncbi:MAG: transposase [Anaerolineales bacterium]
MYRFQNKRHVQCPCNYRLVDCIKNRRILEVSGVERHLKEIIDQVANEWEFEVLPEHVHRLCDVDPQFGVVLAVSLLHRIS